MKKVLKTDLLRKIPKVALNSGFLGSHAFVSLYSNAGNLTFFHFICLFYYKTERIPPRMLLV